MNFICMDGSAAKMIKISLRNDFCRSSYIHLFPIRVCFEFGKFILVADMLSGSYPEIHARACVRIHARMHLGGNGKKRRYAL